VTVYDAVRLYGTSNKAKRVDSLSFIPHSYSVLPTVLSGRIHCYSSELIAMLRRPRFIFFYSFYPRDAMLARVLAMARCLSVTSRCWDKRINLVLALGNSFGQYYAVF